MPITQLDTQTGELTYANGFVPDFETPLDADGDNVYDVIVVRSVLNSVMSALKSRWLRNWLRLK